MSDDDSFTGRFRRYARVGGAMGGLAARLAGERYLGMPIDRGRHAADLKAALGGIKGPLMKVAQLLATIPDALPEEYVRELIQLQANAPAMGWPFVRRRMTGELGPDWQDRYRSFEHEAARAASLGQVHRATATGGGDDRGSFGGSSGTVVVVKEDRGQTASHVEFDVVGQHAEKDVGAHPRRRPMEDRADFQINRLQAAEGALDLGQGFIGTDGLFRREGRRRQVGADHIEPVEAGFAGDVMGPVEAADPPAFRQVACRAPEKIVLQLGGAGMLDAEDLAPLRVDSRHHVPDRAVFPSGIHRLKDQQDGITVGRVVKLLHRAELRNVVFQKLFLLLL